MTSHHDYDIAVIGGGPAGSAAALRAAQLGARVVLIEKNAMPRPKLCGGWVSNRALQLLGFELDSAIIECSFASAEFRFDDQSMTFAPAHPIGVFVDRASFDHYCVNRARVAGTDVLTHRIEAIEQDSTSVKIIPSKGQLTVGAAIICTGANAPLVKCVRETDDPPQYGICIEQRVPADYAEEFGLMQGSARLQFGKVPFGYAWILHHGKYLIVGVGCRRSLCDNIRNEFERFWNSLGLPETLMQPKGHIIPFGGYKRVLGKGRVLTAGDAAGFADPFNGEGISYAIRSGQLAAEAIVTSGEKSPVVIYENLCQNDFAQNLRIALRTARLYYRMPNVFIRAFCSDRTILAKYNEVLEGSLGYKDYLHWVLRRKARIILGKDADPQ